MHISWIRPAIGVISAVFAIAIATRAAAQAVPVPDPDPPQTQQSVSPPPPAPVPVPPVAAPSPPAVEAKSPAEPLSPAVPGPGKFVIWMHDGTRLFGAFGETKAVPFDSIMGKIDIPMTAIHTVDFAFVVNGAKTHRVYLINGDMLTGNVGQVEPVKFQTSYGMLTVRMDEVLKLSAGASPQSPVTPRTNQIGDAIPPKTDNFVPVPIPDAPPGPIRPLRKIVPDAEVK